MATKKKQKAKKQVVKKPGYRMPKVGDEIYIPTALHVYRGRDDFSGGICTIDKIDKSKHLPPDHFNYLFVSVKENPYTNYNYKSLLKEQKELKKEFGKKRGHPDPDNDPEFNPHDSADWGIGIINNHE